MITDTLLWLKISAKVSVGLHSLKDLTGFGGFTSKVVSSSVLIDCWLEAWFSVRAPFHRTV